MLERLLVFVLGTSVAAWVGWQAAGWMGATLGVALLALLMQVLDVMSAARVLNWLRQSIEHDLSDPPRVFGAWREVADRVRRRRRLAQQRLEQSKHTLGSFLNAIQASPNGVMLLDPQGRIEWMNAAAGLHFGLDAQADHLQHVANLVRDPVFADYLNAQMRPEVTSAGTGITLTRWTQLASVLRVQLHPYGDGQRLLLSQDVTANAKTEAMQRDFVANVSHEIRTPLTVLSGFIETMQTLPLGEDERHRYLELMAKQAARQQALINDLLTLSSLEGRARPGAEAQFAVRDMADEYGAEARALAEQVYAPPAAPLAISFTGGDDLHIVGSRNELQSACTNLIHNAVRYCGPGGRVAVSWTLLPDGGAEFAVQDSGPGIAPEHLGRLAERFYRVDSSRSRESGGTGLGLAITRQVAQRHGGELIIQSTLGKGSRFAVRLPAQRTRVDHAQAA